MGECWSRGTATVMILGNVCTRSCGFCNIATGRPPVLDLDEPRRVAEAVALMKLKHCVITSVNRDELPDGGASIWADTIRANPRQPPPAPPSKSSSPTSAATGTPSKPSSTPAPTSSTTTPKPSPPNTKASAPRPNTPARSNSSTAPKPKTSSPKPASWSASAKPTTNCCQTFRDLRDHDVDILTLGQYLQPTREHLPIDRWVTPEQFAEYKRHCLEDLKFAVVESGPLVRSSYHAEEQAELKYLQSRGIIGAAPV